MTAAYRVAIVPGRVSASDSIFLRVILASVTAAFAFSKRMVNLSTSAYLALRSAVAAAILSLKLAKSLLFC